jgi:hypothetical protein
LKDSTGSEEMVVNKLGDLAFVESLRPKHVRIRGGHGGRMKVSDWASCDEKEERKEEEWNGSGLS